MLLQDTKKKFASVILGKLKGESPAGPEPIEDSSVGKEAAVQKLMSCLKSDDAKGCVAALTEFMDMYESEPHDEAEEGEPQEDGEA